jgi:HD-like signal output (HDOD) protein
VVRPPTESGSILVPDPSKATLLLIGLTVLAVGVVALLMWHRSRNRQRTPPEAPVPRERPPASAPASPPAVAAPPPPEVAAGLHKLAFGVALRAASAEPQHRSVAAAVDATFARPVLKTEYAPRRPLLLPKLIQAVNDSEVSRRALGVLIAQDPALAGNLLRLANSAFYRVNDKPVESIDRAVALLGTSGIRSLIATALVQPVFRTSSGQFRRFPEVIWEHTQHSASAAETYAAVMAHADPFAAQLLALLLGLGTIMVFRAALDQYTRQNLEPDAATVAALIERHAPGVARRIAQDWELSERILDALAEQTQPADKPLGLAKSLRFGRYCGSVAVLRTQGVLDEEGALAALRGGGYGGESCERIFARVTREAAAA